MNPRKFQRNPDAMGRVNFDADSTTTTLTPSSFATIFGTTPISDAMHRFLRLRIFVGSSTPLRLRGAGKATWFLAYAGWTEIDLEPYLANDAASTLEIQAGREDSTFMTGNATGEIYAEFMRFPAETGGRLGIPTKRPAHKQPEVQSGVPSSHRTVEPPCGPTLYPSPVSSIHHSSVQAA